MDSVQSSGNTCNPLVASERGETLVKLGFAIQSRDAAEVEIVKQKQFIVATLNMLSDVEKRQFSQRFQAAIQQEDARSASLTDAIRRVLQASGRNWMTVTQVRNNLVESGFDFTGYTANPLASISTTLRRLVPDEAETTKIETVAAYRWKTSRLTEAFRRARKSTLTERIQEFEDSAKK